MKKRSSLRILGICLMIMLQTGTASSQDFSGEKSKSAVQSIIESVNLEELLQTERHLTGEEPFLINGILDSIKTRYSNTPQIYKAQGYIQNKLESYGYTVHLHPFFMGTFYDVDFYKNSKYGWLTTEDHVYGTIDGGQTWTEQLDLGKGIILWSVLAVDSLSAYAVGDQGTILFTRDGGSTWENQTAPVNGFQFGVFFLDKNLGWVCGDNGILKTTNGGQNWQHKQVSPSVRFYDIYFVNADTGWVVGRNGTILKTRDGGTNWQQQTSGTTSRLYGIYFLNGMKGFVVGWDGTLLKTTNGGNNWTQVTLSTFSNLYDIDFLDQSTGTIVGWDGTSLETMDGGNSWEFSGNLFNQRMYACDLLNSSVVWAVGRNTVASSDNFGQTWQSQLDKLPLNSLNNVIAVKDGIKFPGQFYIIGAHYDCTSNDPTEYAPGADDNGSGTSTVIEAARVLKDYDFDYSIKFMLFAGEEQGLNGSAAYANAAASRGEIIQGMINLDMIGYDGNSDNRFEIHAGNLTASQNLGIFVQSNISTLGLDLTPEYHDTGSSSASDHSSFWRANYPAIMIIEDFQDFTPYYHTTNDQLSSLNQSYFLKLARLAIGNLSLLAGVNQTNITEMPTAPGSFELFDPYPNPARSTLRISYNLEKAGQVVLAVYNLLGERVRTLTSSMQSEGLKDLNWDGNLITGQRAPAGLYFIRLQSGRSIQSKKILLLQ